MEDALARHCTGCDCGIPVWVLILVVMEDALAPNPDYQKHVIALVLILVVMEDALARQGKEYRSCSRICLNPCCNGRCTRTVDSVIA